MRSFFKIFFASFLSLIIFCILAFFILVGIISSLTSKEKPVIASKSVLVLDLGQLFHERAQQNNPLAALSEEGNPPGLFDVIRLIRNAKTDNNVSGIYITADDNANGFASSNELRNALLDFKTSRKFVIAYGDVMTQKAYFVANAADKVYVNPSGGFDWKGFSVSFAFLKGTLEKLDIQPQIFYAGKYKSATEMFRTDQMTPENKLQTTVWLNAIYNYFLMQSAKARGLDTATLHLLANTAAIQTPEDAYNNRLIDGVKYDDEVKTEIKKRLGIGRTDKLEFVTINKYNEAINLRHTGGNRIAVIYAEGNIVDGEGASDNIGGDRFLKIIRKARLDDNIKAIVLRVNSGGGSALASDKMWRELQRAREEDHKPVIVSFGDVAASGGYYMSCGADSIFAHPNTITGSIGVFGIIPNMGGFFKNKLGVTFDGVKTAPNADLGAIYRPLSPAEQQQIQRSIERTYMQFKQRVAKGRKRDVNYIDSIAQGRVWIGEDAVRIGLVDRIGSLQDAINSAARMAKITDYNLREFPEAQSWLETLTGKNRNEPAALLKEQLGEENFRVFQQLVKIQEMTHSVQARMPFEFFIQ